MSVKVCSCPKRDKEREENDYDKGRLALTNYNLKKHKCSSNDTKLTSANSHPKRMKLEHTNHLDQDLSVMALKEDLRNVCNQMSELLQKFSQLYEQMRTMQEQSGYKN